MSAREVTLEVHSRPLRMAFLVASQASFLKAVEFYTHLWGGVANYIFPFPKSSLEIEQLKRALEIVDTDIIFYFEDEVNDEILACIYLCSSIKYKIKRSEIEEHITGSNSIRLQEGRISHFGFVLDMRFPEKVMDSGFVLMDTEPNPYQLYLCLQNGIPTNLMSDYFKNHLSAKVIKAPGDPVSFVKVSILLTKFLSPLRSTLIESGYTINSFRPSRHGHTFSIYLDGENTLDVMASFWNERYVQCSNSLLISKKIFMKNTKNILECLLEAVKPRVLYIYTKGKAEQARQIFDLTVSIVDELNREVRLVVSYDLSAYDVLPRVLTFEQPLVSTQAIRLDRSVRFHPLTPIGHKNKDCLFGFTAKVKYDTGLKMALPSTITSALLLSNEIERIKNARENVRQLGALWLYPRFIRAAHNGITGIAVSNKESRFFNHSQEAIIIEHIRQAGIEVRPNKYTRYAQGILRRLGGIEEAINLLDTNTLVLVRAFIASRAEQSGLLLDQIVDYLRKQNIDNPKEFVEKKLPELLEQKMIRRGLALTCKECDLKDWYALEEIGNTIICNGCGENMSLPLQGEHFSYKANELLRRFINTGGHAVFATANILCRLNIAGVIHFGGDLYQEGESTNFAEVDMFWMTDDLFGIVECKSYKRITREDTAKFKDMLINLIEKVAIRIDAKFLLFSVYFTETCDPNLFKVAAQVAERAKQKGLSFHLVVNHLLHPWGESHGQKPDEIRLYDLIYKKTRLKKLKIIGEEPNEWSFGGLVNAVDNEVAKKWLCDQEK